MPRVHPTRIPAAAFTLVAMLAGGTGAQVDTATVPGQRLLSVADAQADLDALRAAIFEAHGAPTRFVSRAELERRWDGYRADIRRPMAEFALVAVVARMMTDLGDGHARVSPDSLTARRMSRTPLFPLRVRVEDGHRLFVVSNQTAADTVARPGTELLSINDRPVRDIVESLAPVMPIDGFIATGRAARIGRSFAQSYHMFVDQQGDFDLVLRDLFGRERRIRLVGVTDSARAAVRNPLNDDFLAQARRLDGPSDNISIRFPDDGAVGVLRVRAFAGDRFVTELDSVLALAEERTVRALVLDLRGNGGGNDLDGANLVGRFARGPFRYFDHIHVATKRPSFAALPPQTIAELDAGLVSEPAGGWLVQPMLHPGVAEQPAARAPFLGPLVVLMDGYTFSTAADVTATLRSLGVATFVGEESGGAYEGNTSGLSVSLSLPRSGIRVAIQMYGYVNAATAPRARGRGTLPDVAIPVRTRDTVRGDDPGMTRALAIAREKAGLR